MEGWSARIVASLQESKRRGLGFDQAWGLALQSHPPAARDLGPEIRSLWAAVEEESVVEFTERVCREAWRNESESAVRHLATSDVDFSRAGLGKSRRIAA